MAFSYSAIDVKKADKETFEKWIKKETESFICCDIKKGWDFCVDIDGGYGGWFWESLALKMILTFDGIIFNGGNSFGWDDHCIHTHFICDGKELTIERTLETPEPDREDFEDEEEYAECMEELADMRAFWEDENDIPYSASFSVEEVLTCAKIYEKVKENLEKADFVKSVCDESNVSAEKFMQFATIFDFDNR